MGAKQFNTKIAQSDLSLYALTKILTESQNLFHKHERKLLLEELLIDILDGEDSKEHEGWKINIFDFEKLSRRAEKLVRRDSCMTLREARNGSTRRLLNIACDETAQNRDRLMAEQAFITVAGLDAKLTGGFDDDVGDETQDALAAIDKDEEHNAVSELNSDEPPAETKDAE